MAGWRIIEGDLFDVLPTLDAESVDACVTDPPYGLGFMGKEWDTFKPEALVANEDSRFRQVDRSRVNHPNANLRNRTRSPAISPSQIEYDRSLTGQRSFQAWTQQWAREVWRVLKPGAHLVVCAAPRSGHRAACGIEDAGFDVRDTLCWLFGQGFPKSKNMGDGWGTALKPAYEPIILARKPPNGSAQANVAKYGTGGLNIDACRIEGANGEGHWSADDGSDATSRPGYDGGFTTGGTQHTAGRWPANVALDEDASALLNEQSGELVSGANPTRRNTDKFRSIYSQFRGQERCTPARGLEAGGASRFFYVAKPDREERDFGCEHLPLRSAGECTDRKDGSAGLRSPRAGAGRTGGGRNVHPTVKPVALMRWLVRLVTPCDGIVLDPFVGSGTTGMACRYEHLRFIGVEREAEYVAIARARVAAVAPLFSVGT